MTTIIDCLQQRGLIDALTSDNFKEITKDPIKVYIGFDPTADSLHLGNLVGIVILRWFQQHGHTPVIVLGGATGRIGDPSGKSIERPLLSQEEVRANVASIRKNFDRILDFDHPTAKPLFLNNDEWMAQFPMIDFLRDVGKHVRINVMLSKDSVRSRLESEEGMSFTEFCYQLLQAYDFYHLHTEQGVLLQMGGSDQWGNIVAGIDLTRKLCHQSVYGLTWPLLTRSDGKKFGKSEGGAIWLSPDRCSPYQFYQYLVRIPDADVIKLLCMLTFLPMDQVQSLAKKMHEPGYQPNTAQKKLAEELTRLVHGEEGLQSALRATEAAAPGSKAKLDASTLEQIAADIPHITRDIAQVVGEKYVDIAAQIGLFPSRGEAVRLVRNGGAYLNDEKITDPQHRLNKDDLIGDRFLLFAAGKKKKMLLSIEKPLA